MDRHQILYQGCTRTVMQDVETYLVNERGYVESQARQAKRVPIKELAIGLSGEFEINDRLISQSQPTLGVLRNFIKLYYLKSKGLQHKKINIKTFAVACTSFNALPW